MAAQTPRKPAGSPSAKKALAKATVDFLAETAHQSHHRGANTRRRTRERSGNRPKPVGRQD